MAFGGVYAGYSCDYPFIEHTSIPILSSPDCLSYPLNYFIPESEPDKATKKKPRKVATWLKSDTPPPRRKILFHDRDSLHHSFSTSSGYPVQYMGLRYPTGEHLFQAMKFMRTRPDLAEYIRTALPRSRQAVSFARTFESFMRADWNDIKIRKIDLVLELKFIQHQALRWELLDTGDAELILNSPKDSFWGIGDNGMGRNELGKALMRLRTRLLAAASPRQRGEAGSGSKPP